MEAIFKDDEIDEIIKGKCPKGFPFETLRAARRKVVMVKAASKLDDLKSPPGNKLHPLTGDRKGQHAIWINAKFRVCFVWTDKGATRIEITDYH